MAGSKSSYKGVDLPLTSALWRFGQQPEKLGNTGALIFNVDLGQLGLSAPRALLYSLNPFIYEGLDAFEEFNAGFVHVFKEGGFSIHHVPEAPYNEAHRANKALLLFGCFFCCLLGSHDFLQT